MKLANLAATSAAGAVALVAAGGVLVYVAVSSLGTSSTPVVRAPDPAPKSAAEPPAYLKPRSAIEAWVMAQDFVRDRLKSPSTAQWGSVWDGTYQKPDEHCSNTSGETWTCSGWVDSQNSFGAMVRTRWTITMTYQRDKAETWHSAGPKFVEP